MPVTPSLIEDARRYLSGKKFTSASLIQRNVRVGFATAAMILLHLEEAGLVSAPLPSGRRKVLMNGETA